MRLTDYACQVIVATAREVFGASAKVRLFGSRLDDAARGGDIDLLIELLQVDPERQRKSLTFAALLQRRLGDQPIDVLVLDPETIPGPVHEHALQTGQLL